MVESLEERALLAVEALPTPFSGVSPDGSLVYSSSANAEIESPGGSDSFTVDVDDGQTITAVVTSDHALQPAIRLSDPSGIDIATAAAAAENEDAVIQAVDTTGAGTYTVSVSGEAGTTGAYSVSLILNAAVEAEEHNGPANGSLAVAQDIDGTFVSLGFGTAQRGAVLGSAKATEVSLLPDVNTDRNDNNPAMSADGLTMVFDSDRTGGAGGNDLYMTTRGSTSEPFTDVLSLGPGVNTAGDESSPVVSSDGLTLFFHSNREGGIGKYDLYMATRESTSDPFTDAVALGAGINSVSDDRDPELSADGLTLLFTSNRLDSGLGRFDLYMATRASTADPFDGVINLGSGVNSDETESTPALSADGLTLLFQSNRPGGLGGTDLYMATRANTFASFGTSSNLGEPINTDLFERGPSFSFDGQSLLFDALRTGGLGGTDLYTAWTDADWYQFSLTDGQSATVALTVEEDGRGTLELYDAEANLLASARPAENVDGLISNFRDTTSDAVPENYFVRIADGAGNYSLVVTKDADFDTEDNDGPGPLAQEISATGTALGRVAGAGVGGSLSFAVIGDWGTSSSAADDVANMINNTGWDVDFVATVGDNNYRDLTPGSSDWENLLGRRYGDFMLGRSDNLYYPLQTSNTQRFFPSVGNHDSDGNGGSIAGYIDYFHSDPSGQGRLPAGVHTEDGSYYDVQIPIEGGGGSVHLFMVDSDHAVADNTSRSDQQQWLEEGLTASTATWKFVLFHHAAYSSSTAHGSDPFMQWDFAQWGADAVFAGHDHTYERIIHPGDGLLYFVNGLGGRSQYEFGSPISGSQFRYNTAHGAMRVTVDPQSATFEFYSIDDGGSGANGGALIDTYTIANQGTLPSEDDYYRVDVAAGEVLTARVRIPAEGPGAFANDLDAAVELLDAGGTVVATGIDGTLQHTAAVSGTYTVRVSAEDETAGEYVLHVDGHTGASTPFEVTATDPADGEKFAVAPTKIRVDLSSQALLTSVDVSDLTAGGVPATNVEIVDGDTLLFTLPPLANGPNAMSIAAGALVDLEGRPIEAFSGELIVDATPPRVVSSSIQEGDQVPAATTLVVTVGFDESLDPTDLDENDILLSGQTTGPLVPALMNYDAATATLQLEYSGLPEDQYTLRLASGDGALKDLVGNNLDGEPVVFPIPPNISGDGVAGGDFVVNFTAEITTAAYPVPLEAREPFGSLVYESSVEGRIGVVGDVDRFTIDLDEGQTVTVVVQGAKSLDADVALIDPSGAEIGTTLADAAPRIAVIQTAGTTDAGTYTVVVRGLEETTGRYTASVILNAAVEAEEHGGPDNNSMAEAQDIDGSFLSLGFGSAERGAVLGTVTSVAVEPVPGVNTPDDEMNPSMSADGLTLVFDSNRPGGPGDTDLYMATRTTTSDPFSSVVALGGEVNTSSDEGSPFLSGDGLTLLFHSSRPGGFGRQDIYMATRSDTSDPFGNVINLGAGVNSDLNELDPAMSADGLTLLLSSNRADTFGGHDLYRATRASTDQPFGNVEHFGSRVNSSGHDRGPALSADGLRLLFHSDRAGTVGGNDLYEATRASTLDGFRQSVRLSTNVNTTSHERGPEFAMDDTTILLDSNRQGGQGNFDLYQAAGTADWYRFTLTDGQSAAVGLKKFNRSSQPPTESVAFQQDVDGYTETQDTFIAEANPDAQAGGAVSLNVDADDPSGSAQAVQSLIRFADVFGDGPDQVRATDHIVRARLELQVTNPGDRIAVHRLLEDWSDTATWNTFGGDGIQADDSEAAATPGFLTNAPEVGTLAIDVTASVLAWQADPASNFGWVLLPTAGNGVDFDSAEGSIAPRLIVERHLERADSVQLTDSQGHVLARGQLDAENFDQLIRNFVDPTSDGVPETYFVRVAASDTDYSLVVTKDADFDTEDNDGSGPLAQDIAAPGTALGSLAIQPLSFAVIGDWGTYEPTADDVANMINNTGWDVNFVATVGDNNYSNLSPGSIDWENLLGRRYGNFMLGRSDNRYPLQASGTQRFFPSVGNHDSSGGGGSIAGYIDYFHTDPSGQGRLPAGVHTEDGSYYDMQIPIEGSGSVHLFMVDSDHARVDNTSRSDQQQWLEEGLTASTATWKFVLFHHAAYSSSSQHGSDPSMQWDFAQWGADAVFAGHDHTYERIIHPGDGLLYFVNGLGGRSQYEFGSPISGSQFRYNTAQGAMRVTVDSQSAKFEFYSINDGASGANGGALIDSYTITNQGTKPSEDDYYRVDVAAGEVLTARVRIPAAGPGQFGNELDAGLEIYDPSGAVVAASANQSVWHTATVDGTYSVRVLSENASAGEYVLAVDTRPLGDMDGDGNVDVDDADALAMALRSPVAYEASYGLPAAAPGDTDNDGDLDFDDINEFVVLLTEGAEALLRAAASGGDRALSSSPTESALAEVWPAVGARAGEPAERFEEAEAAASTEGVQGGRLWRLDPPQEPAVAGTLRREIDRRSAAKRQPTYLPLADELEAAIWSKDVDWLTRVTYDGLT